MLLDTLERVYGSKFLIGVETPFSDMNDIVYFEKVWLKATSNGESLAVEVKKRFRELANNLHLPQNVVVEDPSSSVILRGPQDFRMRHLYVKRKFDLIVPGETDDEGFADLVMRIQKADSDVQVTDVFRWVIGTVKLIQTDDSFLMDIGSVIVSYVFEGTERSTVKEPPHFNVIVPHSDNVSLEYKMRYVMPHMRTAFEQLMSFRLPNRAPVFEAPLEMGPASHRARIYRNLSEREVEAFRESRGADNPRELIAGSW